MKFDSFIGTKFGMSNGGALTVVGKVFPVNWKYEVTCSICNLDKELFPDNFITTKATLNLGGKPCGCGKNYRYSRSQEEVRVKRVCVLKNQTFCGFVGEWEKSKTKMLMSCNVCSFEWDSCTINSLISKNSGCPKCGEGKKKFGALKTDEEATRCFRSSGSYHQNDTFTRNTVRTCSQGYHPYWDFTCHKCSVDKFVKAGVCSGVWNTNGSSLKDGRLPCRCSSHFNYTQGQRELQIGLICEEENLKFLGWQLQSGYSHARSKFRWICSLGHERVTSASTFLSGTRCSRCADLSRSFTVIKGKEQEPDTLYLLKFECYKTKETFIKVGRSFDRRYEGRLVDFRKHYKVTELAINHDTHENAVPLEKDYHEYLSKYHYTPKIPFGGSVLECFTIEALDLLDY